MEEIYFGCPTSQFSCQAATVRHTSERVSPAYFKIHIWPNIATTEWDHNCPPRAEWSLKIICFDRILCIQRLGKYFDRGKISTVDISSEKWFFVRRLFSICDGLKWLQNWSRKMERLNENMRSNTGWRQQCNISPGVWIIFFKGPFIIYACIDSTMMWWNQLNCPIIPIFDACERVKWDRQWWKVSQVSISSLLHIAPCAGPGQHDQRWSIDCLGNVDTHFTQPGVTLSIRQRATIW